MTFLQNLLSVSHLAKTAKTSCEPNVCWCRKEKSGRMRVGVCACDEERTVFWCEYCDCVNLGNWMEYGGRVE